MVGPGIMLNVFLKFLMRNSEISEKEWKMGNFLFIPPCEYWWFLSPKLLKFLKIWRNWMTLMYIQLMQIKYFWGITKLKTVKYQIFHYLCFWHVVYMLIFYSLNHFISFPYLFFPVSQMNVGEIKGILKHCEVSTIIFLWPSLGSLFLLVCSAVGIEKEKK